MIFKFLIISDEVDNFVREISIDSEATFLDLNNAILESVGYTKEEMTSFFLCDDDWEKNTEITLIEMDNDPQFDNWVMKDTKLGDLLEDERQKLLFIFDYIIERAFFMELREIIPGKNLKTAICSKSEGIPPKQTESFEVFEKEKPRMDMGENFYGDEEFAIDELDQEGFDFGENGENATELPSEDIL
ncbi:MAG: hypothetical protein PHV20_10510 [Bacteroidales bacterium]|nr:hypothetical protein [Bacteroidales bacterium]